MVELVANVLLAALEIACAVWMDREEKNRD